MGKFAVGNVGRPKGAVQKVPKRGDLVKLIEYILSDLYINKDELTINDKLRFLQIYKGMFDDTLQNDAAPQTITINMEDWK
jgi:hypothetical protein